MPDYPCCFRCGVLLLHFLPLERCPGCGGPLSAIEVEDAIPKPTAEIAENAEETAVGSKQYAVSSNDE